MFKAATTIKMTSLYVYVTNRSAVDQLNGDTASVFSDAPVSERLPHAIHLSLFAVSVAASAVAAPAAEVAATGEGALTGETAAAESATTDDLVGATCPNSFEATTLVSTIDGKKAIGSLKVGDRVLAYNEATGKTGYYPITKVWVNRDPILTEVILDGEHIETTPHHPFYTEEKGWTNAGDLKLGLHIRKADGSYGLVWWTWNVERTQVMYNLTVDAAHTYFVGSGQWLVHNTGGCPVNFSETQLRSKFKHAPDFGVNAQNPTNPSSTELQAFQEAMEAHLADPATTVIEGTTRGAGGTIPATHFYNPESGLNVMASPSGDYISGWHLYPSQVENLLKFGHIR